MGSGKSTIGKKLAQQLGWRFIDTDERIESTVKMEIREIFKSKGETRFREYEATIIDEIIARDESCVISLGGGTLLSNAILSRVLAAGLLIYIQSEPAEIWKRIKHSTRRPLLRHEGEEWSRDKYLHRMKELMKERQKGYHSAQLTIARDGKEVNEIVEEILIKLNEIKSVG
jgi:shikimate kinase